MSGLTGGCQCGAVRFSVERLGRASLCHCRMCQKAFGGFFGPLVDAHGLTWTKGGPSYFQSSNLARRGFCQSCGTPLTFELQGGPPNVAIGAFDDPAAITPAVQVGLEGKLPYVDHLADLPTLTSDEGARFAAHVAAVTSYQHPDHD